MTNNSQTTGPVGESFQIKKGEPLKNTLNVETLRHGALIVKSVYDSFPIEEFVDSVMDNTWEDLELKARGRQVTLNLGKYLPQDYREALAILEKVAEDYVSGQFVLGFSFPDFVEVYGQDENNWDASINALELFTMLWSSEMAVRPFIINNEERMMEQMLAWSKHENEHIRRLSSEGCRPALPWAMALPEYKKDPAPILPILEQLKTDPSMYVRKSVANNLNDISKTRPDVVKKLASDWYGENKHTDWIIKHGCRTLLKKGDEEILVLFGLGDDSSVSVEDFAMDSSSVSIGNNLGFSFVLNATDLAKVRLEYAIDFVKSGGKTSRKIFKISEIALKANERRRYARNHSFADLSTRKHYPGIHSIAILVNGTEQGKAEFEVIV